MPKYETVIGLEVHVQLSTNSKIFCSCTAKYGLPPNSATCPVCLGLPGVLPVLNDKVFRFAIMTALALDCKIRDVIKFDRKNYYYPDLPKNYQISQFDKPLAFDGSIAVEQNGEAKTIRIKRVHLEEDAGKLMHDAGKGVSYMDFNRTGVPLMEIVSEPDIRSPEEASIYLQDLKAILLYLKVSDCNMEEGSLRCDANISMRQAGEEGLGTKAELKNMNSFKAVRDALSYEAKRQIDILEKGGRVAQETRLWDEQGAVTASMRSKEESHDYRYFPEPDLAAFTVSKSEIEAIRSSLPELPKAKRKRFMDCYALSPYDADLLSRDMEIARFFEEAVKLCNKPKETANWILGAVTNMLKEKRITIKEARFKPAHLGELVELIATEEISGKMGKKILRDAFDTGSSPVELVRRGDLRQIKDNGELASVIESVLAENRRSACDYANGKKNAIMFLVGQVMKKTGGKANPGKVNELLKRRLEETGN
ncbi:MAG: Asp-tRNA(Asn)/Glu-tRNA(Gln) amidotransferase subunit GatB [Candidatus Omnitrophota bacterium]